MHFDQCLMHALFLVMCYISAGNAPVLSIKETKLFSFVNGCKCPSLPPLVCNSNVFTSNVVVWYSVADRKHLLSLRQFLKLRILVYKCGIDCHINFVGHLVSP